MEQAETRPQSRSKRNGAGRRSRAFPIPAAHPRAADRHVPAAAYAVAGDRRAGHQGRRRGGRLRVQDGRRFHPASHEDERYEGEPYQLGTAATIVRMATAPDGAVHAILQGVGRIRLLGLEQSEPWIIGRIERLKRPSNEAPDSNRSYDSVRDSFMRVVTLSETLPQELGAAVSNLGDPSALADFIAANLPHQHRRPLRRPRRAGRQQAPAPWSATISSTRSKCWRCSRRSRPTSAASWTSASASSSCASR